MAFVLLTILLGLVWVVITGRLSPDNLVLGFALAGVVLLVSRRALRGESLWRRAIVLAQFVLFFAWEVVTASFEVAARVLFPRWFPVRPAIVAIPLDLKTHAGIVTLANMITLTPGTLSIDVSADHKTLYVHVMAVDDVQAFVAAIKNDYEQRVIALLE